jgi:uncharacterized damage-inducible protein DinB
MVAASPVPLQPKIERDRLIVMEEAWLRGSIPDVDPMVAPLLMSFQMAREDLARATDGLSDEQIWRKTPGIPSLGFQLRHIAGSVDRLSTYLRGELLTPEQLAYLRDEGQAGAELAELLRGVEEALAHCEAQVREVDPGEFAATRGVGRRALPTTVIGLVVHIAEHTQRHVGQAVLTANLLRAQAAAGLAVAVD